MNHEESVLHCVQNYAAKEIRKGLAEGLEGIEISVSAVQAALRQLEEGFQAKMKLPSFGKKVHLLQLFPNDRIFRMSGNEDNYIVWVLATTDQRTALAENKFVTCTELKLTPSEDIASAIDDDITGEGVDGVKRIASVTVGTLRRK